MQEIYDKLDNHEYLNTDDFKKIISLYSNDKVKTVFVDENSAIPAFTAYELESNSILISKNFKNENLKELTTFFFPYLENADPNFLVDLYNLDTLTTLLHELRHAKQISDIKYENNENLKLKLIKENYNSIKTMPKLYEKNHDLYYFEYDAVISSLIQMLKIINKCKNLDKNSIIEYNRLMTCIIYHSYGNKYQNDNVSKIYDKFTSPISYSIFLSKTMKNSKEKEMVKKCIKDILNKSTTEYLKLLYGCDLSYETTLLLYNIAMKNHETFNMLEDVKKIDNQKVKIK